MFSECLHSLADTANQLILAYGIHKSSQVISKIQIPNCMISTAYVFFLNFRIISNPIQIIRTVIAICVMLPPWYRALEFSALALASLFITE